MSMSIKEAFKGGPSYMISSLYVRRSRAAGVALVVAVEPHASETRGDFAPRKTAKCENSITFVK